ncbi:hypothetical protein TNCT_683961 [Trichonephila clavata]|uniref:Uncharacterized protein n=1 Tax=Trichonephila clavata TaxID=2740835 RepID=A0A8X6HXY4_TRICU|nr:hypothetical protein TNCT_683961 [Trichonephila clavata]
MSGFSRLSAILTKARQRRLHSHHGVLQRRVSTSCKALTPQSCFNAPSNKHKNVQEEHRLRLGSSGGHQTNVEVIFRVPKNLKSIVHISSQLLLN